jgi:hypothetical protein
MSVSLVKKPSKKKQKKKWKEKNVHTASKCLKPNTMQTLNLCEPYPRHCRARYLDSSTVSDNYTLASNFAVVRYESAAQGWQWDTPGLGMIAFEKRKTDLLVATVDYVDSERYPLPRMSVASITGAVGRVEGMRYGYLNGEREGIRTR